MNIVVTQLCLTFCHSMNCSPPDLCPWNSPDKNTGVGSHSLLQGIFPTQGLNLCLLHCKQIHTIWATKEAQSYSYSTPKFMETWIFKTHVSFTFHCPIFPALFLKPPHLDFHYFLSTFSMHKHACYINHLIFCMPATPSFLLSSFGRYIIFKTLTVSSTTELYFPPPDGKLVLPRTEQKWKMCCCQGAEILSLLWGPLDLEHGGCGAKLQLHTTFLGSKAWPLPGLSLERLWYINCLLIALLLTVRLW